MGLLMPAFLALALAATLPAPPMRIDRLMALARLDAAVHYFDPAVATRESSWDALFAQGVLEIANARTSAEYGRLAHVLMEAAHTSTRNGAPATEPYRALVYNGFPTALMQSSGGYSIRWRSAKPGETYRVDLGEGVFVDVPIAEPGDTTGTVAPQKAPTTPGWQKAFPDSGYRILAAARLWSTIHYFYPYKALIGESWDAQLRAALPEFQAARDAREYGIAVAHFASHIHDTHVTVGSRALAYYVGNTPVGAVARLIDDRAGAPVQQASADRDPQRALAGAQLVVTRIADTSALSAGLRVGDVILSIDGEPTAKRVARLAPLFSVSTPQSLRYRLEQVLLNGSDTTPARLVVRGATGGERSLVVSRSPLFVTRLGKHRTTSIIRMLPGNIGYVDLDRLTPMMVDSAFRLFKDTKAIILDDRGYPLGTAWSIGPRLNVHADSTTAARFMRLIVPSPDTAQTTRFAFEQPIPPAYGAPRYTGQTVLLVDERTISQAEHTGLFFEAANGTKIVGTPTMGANGDITVMAMPGGVTMSFTGHDVRHADGRQLQRVGLKPDLVVAPTVAGIRAGRDEVLNAAFRLVGGSGDVPIDTLVDPGPPAAAAPQVTIAGWGGGGAGYELGLDRTTMHGGSASGRITTRDSSTKAMGVLTQAIKADAYRGKRIKLRAFVKTRDVEVAGLWMRVDGQGGYLAMDNMMNRPLRGSMDWTAVAIVLDVPQDADAIMYGMLAHGGDAWIDDASLEVVGADESSTNSQPPAPKPAEAEAMRRRYAELPTAPRNLGFEPQ